MRHKLYFHKKSWYKGENPYRCLTVDLRQWPTSDQRKVLRSIAKDWGCINWQQTIPVKDGTAINFGCSGHGGILMFSHTKYENLQGFITHSHRGYENYRFPKPWYVYEFEEDCGWAVFFLHLSEKGIKSYMKDYDHLVRNLGYNGAVDHLTQAALDSRNHYNKDVQLIPNLL